MAVNDVLIMPPDASEPLFVRYLRSTLIKAVGGSTSNVLFLGGRGGYDILEFSTAVVQAYQWRSIYCKPLKNEDGPHRNPTGLLCIGEAIGTDLKEALGNAGLGMIFTVIGGSEYKKAGRANRSAWVFDPRTSPIGYQHTISASSAIPDWTSFNTYITGELVAAALRY